MDDALEAWAEETVEEIAEEMVLNNEPIDKIIKYTKLPEKKF
jgi:hypothetical protein